MKYTLRIPTKEQYAYIEATYEGEALAIPEELVQAYNDLTRAVQGGAGLPAKEWNAWLDKYLSGSAGSVEEWEQMNDMQKFCVNEIKKSKKR